MSYIDDTVLDAALGIIDNATVLHILSTEPASFANIATYTLGNKATPGFTGPAAGDTSGRKITINAITDGTVTGTGTAAYWCLATGSVLLAAGALSASQGVTSGNTFTLAAFDIEFPDPA